MQLFQEMVFTSFLCSGLILLIWAVNKAVGHRYQRTWRYYLWVLIGIRLLIPFDFSFKEAPILFDREKIYRLAVEEKDLLVAEEKDLLPTGEEDILKAGKEDISADKQEDVYSAGGSAEIGGQNSLLHDTKNEPETIRIPWDEVWNVVFIIWLSGAAIVILCDLTGYLLQKRRIYRSCFPLEDTQIRRLWEQMRIEAEVRQSIPIYRSSIVYAPLVAGLRSKCLLLPERNYEEKELVHIFRHELQHLKHHDIWVKMLYLVLCAVYWFQPAVWLMQREMGKDLEALCDRRAVRGFAAAERYSYTQTMIRCMSGRKGAYMPVSSGFSGDVKTMKERIRLIMKGNKLKKGFGIFSLMVMLMTAGIFLVSCGEKGKETADSEQMNGEVEPEDNSQAEINTESDAAAPPRFSFEIPESWKEKVGVEPKAYHSSDAATVYYTKGLKTDENDIARYQEIFNILRLDEDVDLDEMRGFYDRFDILGSKDGYTFVMTQLTDTALGYYDESVWDDVKSMMSDEGLEAVKNSFTIQ